jgi:hydroxymethylpyrimidine pyrophosphatase-like HAD family hydrolase
MNKYIISIDFDGTIAKQTDDLIPKKLIPNAKEVINWCYDKGCYIIIWTCRSGKSQISSMMKFLKDNKIKFHIVNKNAPWITFTDSPKIFANLYIDDRGLCEIDWLKIKDKIRQELIKEISKDILGKS